MAPGRTAMVAVFLAQLPRSAVFPAPAASAANALTLLGTDVSTAAMFAIVPRQWQWQ